MLTARTDEFCAEQRDAYVGVLREGLAINALDVPGLYFGTSTGQIFASADEGESWQRVVEHLPDVVCVRAAEVR